VYTGCHAVCPAPTRSGLGGGSGSRREFSAPAWRARRSGSVYDPSVCSEHVAPSGSAGCAVDPAAALATYWDTLSGRSAYHRSSRHGHHDSCCAHARARTSVITSTRDRQAAIRTPDHGASGRRALVLGRRVVLASARSSTSLSGPVEGRGACGRTTAIRACSAWHLSELEPACTGASTTRRGLVVDPCAVQPHVPSGS